MQQQQQQQQQPATSAKDATSTTTSTSRGLSDARHDNSALNLQTSSNKDKSKEEYFFLRCGLRIKTASRLSTYKIAGQAQLVCPAFTLALLWWAFLFCSLQGSRERDRERRRKKKLIRNFLHHPPTSNYNVFHLILVM